METTLLLARQTIVFMVFSEKLAKNPFIIGYNQHVSRKVS